MTSEEIAKLCGVWQKILAVIKEKNYVPIAPARRLAGIDSNIIGLFVLDIDISESKSRVSESTYFSRLINLIIDQANNFGFQVLVSIITSQKQLSEIRNLFMSRTIFSGIFAFNDEIQLDDDIIMQHPTIIIGQL